MSKATVSAHGIGTSLPQTGKDKIDEKKKEKKLKKSIPSESQHKNSGLIAKFRRMNDKKKH